MSDQGPSSPQYRIAFTATARFGNGGDVRLNDFMLDWPHDRPDDELLKRMIVQNLRLLMVHEIDVHDVRVVPGLHKGLPAERASSAPVAGRRLIASTEGSAVDVPMDRPLAAALVELSGHQHQEVGELTVYGAWSGQPVLVLSGLEGHHLTAATLSALHGAGLRWVVADAALTSSVLPTTLAPRFVAAATSQLLDVALVDDRHGGHLLIGTVADPDPLERSTRR